MSRSPAFQDVLEGIRRREEIEDDRLADEIVARRFSAAASFVGIERSEADADRLWDRAATFTPYEEDSALPEPEPASEDPAAIAGELGLGFDLSAAQLQAARRRFMWLNHPDRRKDIPADLANRRVAIANMLIDLALSRPQARARRS